VAVQNGTNFHLPCWREDRALRPEAFVDLRRLLAFSDLYVCMQMQPVFFKVRIRWRNGRRESNTGALGDDRHPPCFNQLDERRPGQASRILRRRSSRKIPTKARMEYWVSSNEAEPRPNRTYALLPRR